MDDSAPERSISGMKLLSRQNFFRLQNHIPDIPDGGFHGKMFDPVDAAPLELGLETVSVGDQPLMGIHLPAFVIFEFVHRKNPFLYKSGFFLLVSGY
jgi:hypothetical protein